MQRPTVDEPLVRALLREQHPELAELSLHRVPGGWDNELWRLGDELAVRLPLTPRAPELLRKEQRWLPLLAPGLPLPVPVPVRTGAPSRRFPRPWSVAMWVPGEPADRAGIGHGHEAADALALFLRALHRNAPADAPVSGNRGVALGALAPEFDEKFAAAEVSGSLGDGVRAVWDEAVAAPQWRGAPVWIHGDLHPANVVVSDGSLSGVIDFGELCAGDPATDLAAAWVLLPGDAAARFLDAYADADEAMVRRARGWAVLRAVSLIGIGLAWERGLPGGQPTWGRAGTAALARITGPSFAQKSVPDGLPQRQHLPHDRS
ncbi:aminoglycoside phosphotransferase family protein [Streptomyces sp. NBC_01205]|uniref:aminoglycoside phosphotransferase family protein n=2 Tax=Streptomyces TaxID=1883 RepID=UPI002E0EDE45|nr:aminoglycoside phosphotransferase family protein [Streptomyces sp. NBC_01205]